MTRDTVFVDTSAWFSLADKTDHYHQQAITLFPKLLKGYPCLTTTNLVIAETYILIRRALGHQPAIAFLENIAASPRVTKIYSDRELEKAAEEILRKFQDQEFSFVDAVSFSLMKKHGIGEAFSFDLHFKIAGFILLPKMDRN